MNNDTTNNEVDTTAVATDTLGEVSEVITPTELSEEVLDILPAVASEEVVAAVEEVASVVAGE